MERLEGIMYNERMLSGIDGTPTMWMEMGRVQERERWHAFTSGLLIRAIGSELDELKRKVAETLQSLHSSSTTQITRCLLPIIDARKENIANILGDYVKSSSNDSKTNNAHDNVDDTLVEVASKEPLSNETRSVLNFFQGIGLFVGSIILMRLLS